MSKSKVEKDGAQLTGPVAGADVVPDLGAVASGLLQPPPVEQGVDLGAMAPPTKPPGAVDCPTCKGSGSRYDDHGPGATEEVACGDCEGSGWIEPEAISGQGLPVPGTDVHDDLVEAAELEDEEPPLERAPDWWPDSEKGQSLVMEAGDDLRCSPRDILNLRIYSLEPPKIVLVFRSGLKLEWPKEKRVLTLAERGKSTARKTPEGELTGKMWPKKA